MIIVLSDCATTVGVSPQWVNLVICVKIEHFLAGLKEWYSGYSLEFQGFFVDIGKYSRASISALQLSGQDFTFSSLNL